MWVAFSRGESRNSNHDVLDTDQLLLNQWNTIQVSQELSDVGTFIIRLEVGCREIFKLENDKPRTFSNVKVYASNPWSAAQPGFIRNIVVQTKGL